MYIFILIAKIQWYGEIHKLRMQNAKVRQWSIVIHIYIAGKKNDINITQESLIFDSLF